MIQLYFGSLFGEHELRWSHTNHDTGKRAERWAAINPELGDPNECDWTAVTRASRRLNRAITSLAVDKVGSHPVLPEAARLVRERNLVHQYGTGIHAAPAFASPAAVPQADS